MRLGSRPGLPAHAVLNYLHAILESETTIAAYRMGFDPSLGLMHVDKRYRPSLSWFMLLFQFPGVAEEWLSANQWTNFRILFRHPDEDGVIADLEANSSLTPGLNYFRAIVNPESFLGPSTRPAPSTGPNAGRLEQRRLRADRGPDDPLGGACRRPVAL